jgi:hypothetical protein
MVLRGKNEWAAFAVKFSYQHTRGVSRELQTAIGIEVISSE